MRLLIVGAGAMAKAHAAAARQRGDIAVSAVCRSAASAEAFSQATGIACGSGGLKALEGSLDQFDCAIVATPVETLAEISSQLATGGIRRLLVEKPAGLDVAEMRALASLAASTGAEMFVAYNRRFYASTKRAKDIIEADGGATSVRFDFTERSEIVEDSKQAPQVKQNWLFANSSHVIDLAFYLAGDPVSLNAHVAGSLPWHPAGARFVGSGLTGRGAAFSYHADWEAPGRWTVDVRTRKRRLLFEPLEELKSQERGSFEIKNVDIPSEPEGLKPGVLDQLNSFLAVKVGAPLLSIADHARRAESIYAPILAGRSDTRRDA